MDIKNPKTILLIAISLFLCMMFIDETGVSVTLPIMQTELHLSIVSTQWVMNAMFLPIAIFVLFGGKLSDHIGYRKVFTLGMLIFLIASLICTFANNDMEMILGRALQGFGASLLLATYAVLIAMLFPENERGVALGTSASIGSIFLATGPFIGGLFTHYLTWRWIFAVNIPLGLISLILVFKSIVGHKGNVKSIQSFDFFGLLLFVVGFTALTYALMQAVDFGWTSKITIILLLVAILLLPFFAWYETRQGMPLANLALFKKANFLAGSIILLCTQVVVMSLTYWAIWLQKSLGFSPLQTGIGLLPAGIPILFMARIGGQWLDKSGPRLPIGIGSLIVLSGMFWLALTAHLQSYDFAVIGFLAYGIGAPLVISPAIAVVMNSVDAHERGMASGMMNTMRQLGAALCFAIVGVVITNLQHIASIKAHTLNTIANSQTTAPFDYSIAFSWGMVVTTVFAVISSIFAWFVLKNN